MKKHKVEIPEGYEPGTLEYDTYLDNDGNKHYIAARLTLIPTEKQLPKTWEEYKHTKRNILETEPFDIVIPQKYTHPFRALIRLIQLRDHFNDGWEPDWIDDSSKYVIYIYRTLLDIATVQYAGHILSFKTSELRDKFLSNFRDLIEKAKPLL